MSDLLDWPKYDARTSSAEPLPPAPSPVYTRPASPKQPGRPAGRCHSRRDRTLDALSTGVAFLVGCAVAFIVVLALVLGFRDIFRFIFGGS